MNKEDIELLNYLKQYLQEKIDDGYNKLFYGEEMYDFKTIDAINAIEDLQCLLEEKQKIIDELKKDLNLIIEYGQDEDASRWEQQYGECAKNVLSTLNKLETEVN